MKVSRTWRLFGLALGLWLIDQPSARAADSLRIRIFADHALDEATFRGVDAPLSVLGGESGHPLAVVPAGSDLNVRRTQAGLRLRWSGGEVDVPSVRLRIRTGALVKVAPGRSQSGGGARTYRGLLSIHLPGEDHADDGMLLVNEVAVDDYVAAVLPAEYPFRASAGVKAQAVVIRTYALGTPRKFGALYDLVDTELSQVYRGAGYETALSRRAADETRGQVLRYRNRLIEAVYSSQCGGHSADNESIWQTAPKPYLRGKPDPFERETPHARWTVELDRKRLLDAFSRRYGFEVRDIRVETTGRDGRVRSVRLSGTEDRIVTGSKFQAQVNRAFGRRTLRSTYFALRPGRRTYQVDGRGFGHGVGLCQYGADARARAGHSYEDILAFYYSNVSLDDRPLTSPSPPVRLASAPSPAGPQEAAPAPRRIAARRTTGWARRLPEPASRPPASSTETGSPPPASTRVPETGRRIGW